MYKEVEVEIQIVLDSPVPVYRQIADGLRTLCVSGELKAGDRLPTVRELAADLGVHFNTVAEAYRILADEGWLLLERRRGASVRDRAMPDVPSAIAHSEEGGRLHHVVASLLSKGFSKDWIRRELQAALEDSE
jgi:DNA-binding transcriptional regulator YhcF (GntR family)